MYKVDVGCGGTLTRRAPGYDVYTDVRGPAGDFDGKFVQCAIEEMPFGNKEFDYARCHHVIEHCQDPDRACFEIIRIAKEGIISFPPMQAEMLFGRKDHNWYVAVDKGRLLFIEKWHESLGIPRSETACELNVNFEWKGTFEWLTVRL